METVVSFLITRVKVPLDNDWKNQKQVLVYLNGTLDDVHIIGSDNMSQLSTWVDAAYDVHPNKQSNFEGVISFGWGTLHSKRTKQKWNTKSLAEAELVGFSEYLSHIIWLTNF